MKSSNGEFSVKSTFKEVIHEDLDPEINVVMNQIWKSNLHQRLKMHLWRIAVGVLPTKESLFAGFCLTLTSLAPYAMLVLNLWSIFYGNVI